MTRVLIADDRAANLYLLESILKGNGYEVTQAKNGAEALALAQDDPPDLIITDILMPVMDGFDLCRRLKADDRLKGIPFLFYTATFTDPRDEQLAKDLGADRFMVKPLKPEVLVREIQAVLAEVRGREVTEPGARRDEKELLQDYSEALFRKLEIKVRQLEEQITIRKAAQEELELVVRELEQKNAELARFTYTVSHELRSPLVTIQGFAGLIEEEMAAMGNPPGQQAHVRRISVAVDTMDALLTDLLRLSHAGEGADKKETVRFDTIAREAADLLSQLLEDRGVQLEIEPDLPFVEVDHNHLQEALVNLIENAIKFSGNETAPKIRIGYGTSEDEAAFYVQDNGIGIDPRYLER
ncbi:MAG: response regulator, partial [Methanomicrobiales archaeon]|nr:response regulator [Methanomicrobiales archaeon]